MLRHLNDEAADNRLLAAKATRDLSSGDPDLRAALFALMGDDDSAVRDYAIGQLPELLSETSTATAAAALHILPSPEHQERAIELLDKLARAIHTLQDLELDEAQHHIVDKVILPSIAELQAMLPVEATDMAEVASSRRTALGRLGSLLGSTKALLAINVAANADEAVANVSAAATEASVMLDWLFDAIQHTVGA